jgi:aminopeptidase N
VRPEVYHEINNFYTTTIYEKGAEVVRMLKTWLGATQFRAGMDLYFARHDGEAATIEQFVQCFADAANRDLSQFMRWYSQAGTPEVVAAGSYDATQRSYRLELTQTVPATPGQPVKQPMVIPLALGLVDAAGKDLALTLSDGQTIAGGVIALTAPSETFTFTNIAQRPVLSLNRGFSAPIKLAVNVSAQDLQFLAGHDPDAFNRWQALQTLATRLLVARASAAVAASGGEDGLIAALSATLSDPALEPALVAQAITLPSEADIAREIGRDVDPDAIFQARRDLRAAVGLALGGGLAQTYARLSDPAPYRPDAAGAGRRALRNACLDLMAATGTDEAIRRAFKQYEAADNMTDRMAALTTLSLHDRPERTQALDDFYRRYANDPLIVDKWLAVQAMIPEPATLDRVRALTDHPAFSFANPNRVRSLIGSFAQGNHTQFNRLDGAGHNFLADTVLALDARNPQVAARMLSAFKSWRALEPRRRQQAESALRRVAAAEGLSADVQDIARRALADS